MNKVIGGTHGNESIIAHPGGLNQQSDEKDQHQNDHFSGAKSFQHDSP
jgi:hypothetical protein